ncbi:MAG TPA: TetR/AcrR family transcriptional regulator [Solirubrobacter sp.]|nr:TetR/AcrR family transcriptional regulator [Solirubrobacter sp.]
MPAVATRGRPRDPRRRDAILSAAVTLITEVGYDRMTVEALAARAGVSKPTIYRRWPGGKKEIVLDAIRVKHEAVNALPDHGSLRGDLLALLAATIEHIDEEAHLAAGLISRLRESEELATIMREEVVANGRCRLDGLLERAVARGELSADARITPLFHDIAGSILFTRSVVLGESLDRAFLEELVDHVLLPVLHIPPQKA